ncbi:hypothetical protein BH23ACT12_BH23ACT12_14760 [soil metagenome]
MVARSRIRTLSAPLLLVLALAACNTADDSSDAITTGEQVQFEIAGDVSAVDIEDVDVDPGISVGPDGIDVDPQASFRVQLTVNIESINDEAARLCDLQAGSDTIVIVTEDTDLDFGRSITEMDTLDDESIVATGMAEERLIESDATPTTTDPDGACVLSVERLRLDEEAATTTTPSPTSSPSPTP